MEREHCHDCGDELDDDEEYICDECLEESEEFLEEDEDEDGLGTAY